MSVSRFDFLFVEMEQRVLVLFVISYQDFLNGVGFTGFSDKIWRS